MAHDVFITYSSHDKSVAEAVCATLESRQIPCWIAPRDVLPGTEWAEAIVDAIDNSRVIVLVLSSSSNSSPQVIREVGKAASKGIPIIPLRIDDVPLSKAMEFFVSSHHFLDAQTPPLEKHLQKLADTVQQLLAREIETLKVTEIAEEKPAVFVERPAEGIKVEKPLLKRPWLWAVSASLLVGLVFLIVGLLPETVPEPTIPTLHSIYTQEGLFSISYPPTWTPAFSIMEEIWGASKEYVESLDPDVYLEDASMVFFGGIQTEDGYYPNVSVVVTPRSEGYWTLDEIVEEEDRFNRKNLLGYREFSRVRTTIGGIEAVLVESEDYDPDLGTWRYLQAYITKGEYVWLVTCGSESDDYQDYQETFDSVVRSFRFLN